VKAEAKVPEREGLVPPLLISEIGCGWAAPYKLICTIDDGSVSTPFQPPLKSNGTQ
jgi:hypothetical protein